MLVNTGGGGDYCGAILTSIMAFDAHTLAVQAVRDITEVFGFSTDRCQSLPLSLVTAPGPPRHLSATVSGRDLVLTWANVGDAAAFVLDVGLASGRTDVSIYLGGGTSASFVAVPPGTYYARVRGGNAVGGGRPSKEVVVSIP